MNGMRCNSSPHSLKLQPHLIIEVRVGTSWASIAKLLQKKLPWRELPPADKPLNHIANTFPFKCPRCPYRCRNQVRIRLAMYLAVYLVIT